MMGNHGHREQEMPGSRSCPIAEERPWPDEVRSRSALAPDAVDLNKNKIQGAIELMDSMTTDDISGHRDHYREALVELTAAKSEGKEPPQPAEDHAPQPGQVVDLLAALYASVQRKSRYSTEVQQPRTGLT
ncbi:hypothetical protein ACFYWN_46440 [Streptomyces sp. NPDC002917]|uniref:hypothetical protein n=1 Tax=unclassified Streptomyces TaxID=2593676 RepID=UPI0033B6A40C